MKVRTCLVKFQYHMAMNKVGVYVESFQGILCKVYLIILEKTSGVNFPYLN
jgi:hypothetical protein